MTAETKTAKEVQTETAKEVQTEVKPVHFVILVSLETDSDGDQYTVPRNIPNPLHRGDTVSYESPDGQVTVEFDEDQDGSVHTSPYVDATGKDLRTVHSGVVLNVVNKGNYFGKCFITRTILSSPTTLGSLPLDPKLSDEARERLAAWSSMQTGLTANGDPVTVKVQGLIANGDPVTVKVRTEKIGWKEKDISKQHTPTPDNSEEVELESGGNHIVRP